MQFLKQLCLIVFAGWPTDIVNEYEIPDLDVVNFRVREVDIWSRGLYADTWPELQPVQF